MTARNCQPDRQVQHRWGRPGGHGLWIRKEREALGRQRPSQPNPSQEAEGQTHARGYLPGQWPEVEGPRFRRARLRPAERPMARVIRPPAPAMAPRSRGWNTPISPMESSQTHPRGQQQIRRDPPRRESPGVWRRPASAAPPYSGVLALAVARYPA